MKAYFDVFVDEDRAPDEVFPADLVESAGSSFMILRIHLQAARISLFNMTAADAEQLVDVLLAGIRRHQEKKA
jgi:hypothetical protein